jgi:hypothetical protein
MNKANRYIFSFTGASLRLSEMVMVAQHLASDEQFDFVSKIGGGKSKTGRVIYEECVKRISTLTPEQKEILMDGDITSQKQIAFLGVCKFHAFIRDFTVEVIREKYLLFDYHLTSGDYYSFYRRKAEVHPEMEKFTSHTENKVRQVTFKILEQSGIIDDIKNKNIQLQLLDHKVMRAIVNDDSDWLKIFLLSDADINNAIE